jgi:hypothetical protein
MEFVLLIYQGTTPLPNSKEWKALSEEEQRQIYTDYDAVNKTPGVKPGLPLGLPLDATTVRIQNGKAVTAKGPYADARGAVGGYFTFEAENLDAAIQLAARIPAARLGGGVEIRPAEKYW